MTTLITKNGDRARVDQNPDEVLDLLDQVREDNDYAHLTAGGERFYIRPSQVEVVEED